MGFFWWEDHVRKAAEDQAERHNSKAPVSSQQSSKLRQRQPRRNVRTPVKFQDFVMEKTKRIGIIKAMFLTPESLTSLKTGGILQAYAKEQTKASASMPSRSHMRPACCRRGATGNQLIMWVNIWTEISSNYCQSARMSPLLQKLAKTSTLLQRKFKHSLALVSSCRACAIHV